MNNYLCGMPIMLEISFDVLKTQYIFTTIVIKQHNTPEKDSELYQICQNYSVHSQASNNSPPHTRPSPLCCNTVNNSWWTGFLDFQASTVRSLSEILESGYNTRKKKNHPVTTRIRLELRFLVKGSICT